MLSIYKYGLPEGMTKEEIVLLREKIAKLKADTDALLQDKDKMEQIRKDAAFTSRLRPCDLYRQFTI